MTDEDPRVANSQCQAYNILMRSSRLGVEGTVGVQVGGGGRAQAVQLLTSIAKLLSVDLTVTLTLYCRSDSYK